MRGIWIWNPASRGSDARDGALSAIIGTARKDDPLRSAQEGGSTASSMASLGASGASLRHSPSGTVERAPLPPFRGLSQSLFFLPCPFGCRLPPSFGSPAARRRPLTRYLLNSADSPARAGLKFQVSFFDPRPYFIFRKSGGAAGAAAAQIDAIPR